MLGQRRAGLVYLSIGWKWTLQKQVIKKKNLKFLLKNLLRASFPRTPCHSSSRWSEVIQSWPTLCDPTDCSLPGSSIHGIFPGKSTGVGCHCLLRQWGTTWQQKRMNAIHTITWMNLIVPCWVKGTRHKNNQTFFKKSYKRVIFYILWIEKIHNLKDGDCSHEIKRHLLLGRKVMTNLDSILKSRDITLPTKVCLVKAMVFPVVM